MKPKELRNKRILRKLVKISTNLIEKKTVKSVDKDHSDDKDSTIVVKS